MVKSGCVQAVISKSAASIIVSCMLCCTLQSHTHTHTRTHSGGTQSDVVILTEAGEVVGQAQGTGTNPWVSLTGQENQQSSPIL